MDKWQGLDRRKFPRVNYPCLIVIRKDQNETGQDILLTHTENIGIGGVCVIIKHNLDVYKCIDIEIDLLDLEEHIKCSARIVWNVQRKGDENKKPAFYDIGMEFLDLSPRDIKRLEEVVSRLVRNQSKSAAAES